MSSRGRPAGSAPITNGYTPQQGDALMRDASRADMTQLSAGLNYFIDLLRSNNVDYALMGGLALTFRGSTRETHDVDLTTACDMGMLRQICRGRSRVRMPLGPTSGVMRVFVEVGPQYGDSPINALVQIDLILPGSLGAPAQLEGHTETITVTTLQGQRNYVVINLLSHFQAKLNAFTARGSQADFVDLIFMATKYAPRVAGFRSQLNIEQRQLFITRFTAAHQGAANVNRVRKMKQILGVP